MYRLLSIILLAPSLAVAGELTDAQKADLAAYAKVRAALVNMDLAGARAAASAAAADGSTLPETREAAAALGASANIKEACRAFQRWSDALIPVAKGRPGYYIAHCPMVKGTWIQTDRKITNPFAGDTMPACGAILDK